MHLKNIPVGIPEQLLTVTLMLEGIVIGVASAQMIKQKRRLGEDLTADESYMQKLVSAA